MTAADIFKHIANLVVAVAFVVAACLGKIDWRIALGAVGLLLTPSSLPEIAKLLLAGNAPKDTTPPSGASVINPNDEKGNSP